MSDYTTASLVRLANGALALIGEPPINALTDNRDAARAVNENLTQAIESVLRMHPWRCALGRASLNRLQETPPSGYRYQYQLPGDCLRVEGVGSRTRYSVEGRRLLSDSSSETILYVRRVEDMNEISADVQKLIEVELAIALAARLRSTNTQLSGRLDRLKESREGEARHASAQESLGETDPPVSWEAAWSNGSNGGHTGRGWV
jgi:hypothetical protein